MQRICTYIFIFIAFLNNVAWSQWPPTHTCEAGTSACKSIELKVGESIVIPVTEGAWQRLLQITNTDPKIVEVTGIAAGNAVLVGRAVGSAVVYAWHEGTNGFRKQCVYRVKVTEESLESVAEKIKNTLASRFKHVTVRIAGKSILLEGQVATEAESSKAEAIAKAYHANVLNQIDVAPSKISENLIASLNEALANWGLKTNILPDGTVAVSGAVKSKEDLQAVAAVLQHWNKDLKILNIVAQAPQPTRQVMIKAKVVEMNRSDAMKLGVLYGQDRGPGIANQPFVVGGIGKGLISLTSAIEANIDALIQDNKAKLLSEPRMLVMEGEKAQMLVGGEIPVPVVQSGNATGGITVEWKEFGVSLDVVPKIMPDDVVDLKIVPSVSSLDFANGIKIENFQIPALKTRKAETSVQVKNGNTIVIAGLIQKDEVAILSKIPLLGDIPIIGELFRHRDRKVSDTDLIIFVTPEIAGAG